MLQLFLCMILLILFLAFPIIAHEGAEYGLQLYLDTLLPYFLPIIILSNWLLSISNPTSTSKGALYSKAYMLSAVGGYPTGAVIISKLLHSGAISKKEAELLLPCLHFPNPLFIIGFYAVDLIHNSYIGFAYLLTIHIVSICALWFVYIRFPHPVLPRHEAPERSTFSDAIRESVQPLLIVGVTIIFFTTIAAICLFIFDTLDTVHIALPLIFISGLELTNGLILANELLLPEVFLYFSVLILTTQSLSIHLQVAVIARGMKLRLKPYILIRIFISIIVLVIFHGIIRLFGI